MSRVASACRKLVLIQLGSPVVLISSVILWEKTDQVFFLFFGAASMFFNGNLWSLHLTSAPPMSLLSSIVPYQRRGI